MRVIFDAFLGSDWVRRGWARIPVRMSSAHREECDAVCVRRFALSPAMSGAKPGLVQYFGRPGGLVLAVSTALLGDKCQRSSVLA